nr:glycosyltransferase family 4 protein [Methylocystis echinoides]
MHAAAWYAPYHIGGTEVYVEGLVEELARRGIKSTIIVPRAAGAAAVYEHAGTRVETYPVSDVPSKAELRDNSRGPEFDGFLRCLAQNRGSIYHQHSWTRGCGLPHLLAAKGMGFSTVLTVHVPSNICLRGTMRRFGEMGCNGKIDETICGACWLHERGLSRPIAARVAALPLSVSRAAGQLSSRFGTALSARALASSKLDSMRMMISAADRVVAVCEWVHEALLNNGVPRAKLILNRQGISKSFENSAMEVLENASRSGNDTGRLSLLYIGSFNPTKGIDIAVRAIRSLPEALPVRLDIRAPSGGPEQQTYEEYVRALAGNDPRIAFQGPLNRNEIAREMRLHDALLVPSVWMETGPLVVLEAQAVGLPVIGSKIGGIAELMHEPEDGALVPPGDVLAWAAAIEQFLSKGMNNLTRRTAKSVRTMVNVGDEMVPVYEKLIVASLRANSTGG